MPDPRKIEEAHEKELEEMLRQDELDTIEITDNEQEYQFTGNEIEQGVETI